MGWTTQTFTNSPEGSLLNEFLEPTENVASTENRKIRIYGKYGKANVVIYLCLRLAAALARVGAHERVGAYASFKRLASGHPG
jgi:homoaconitase/3-isopropylmalate dehydratase large subunit